MNLEISKTFTFEASHILPRHKGKCSRLHGHSWKLTVYVKGPVDKETGFVLDYSDLKSAVQPLIDALDHRHLGSWEPPIFDPSFIKQSHFVQGLPFDFYPSSENLIMWIADQLQKCRYYISSPSSVTTHPGWSRLELDETCTSKCILTREEYEAEKRVRG